jgi:enterochelin esterase-like enzyme
MKRLPSGDRAVAACDAVRRLVHEVAQPLATGALALDVALLADARQDAQEAGRRMQDAAQAISEAQAVLQAWSDACRERRS